jgi:hypothetical protein
MAPPYAIGRQLRRTRRAWFTPGLAWPQRPRGCSSCSSEQSQGSIWTAGGTGVPGIDVGQADALPPEEEDVRRPEHRDDSR